jgi:hypothetical protein
MCRAENRLENRRKSDWKTGRKELENPRKTDGEGSPSYSPKGFPPLGGVIPRPAGLGSTRVYLKLAPSLGPRGHGNSAAPRCYLDRSADHTVCSWQYSVNIGPKTPFRRDYGLAAVKRQAAFRGDLPAGLRRHPSGSSTDAMAADAATTTMEALPASALPSGTSINLAFVPQRGSQITPDCGAPGARPGCLNAPA